MIELIGVNIGGIDIFITVIILSFFFELMDSSLGMGYGTTLTPVLLLIGFDNVLAIIPAILLSQFLCGIAAGAAHHKIGNVNFTRGGAHLKVALILAACSIVGATAAVFVALELPNIFLKTYIGLMVLIMGIVIILTMNKSYKFSLKRITALGILAAFNKGMSGGGYGPVVTGGQLLSGVEGNNAVGITSLAEGLTSFAGFSMFLIAPALIFTGVVDWSLAPSLVIGSMLSIPFSANIVKRIDTKTLKMSIGLLTITLGLFTLAKVYVL